MKKNIYTELIESAFNEHVNVLKETHTTIADNIELSADIIAKSLALGGTIFWCGNGGSAADSQHIAAEFVGRFKKDRRPLRSIALTTDTSILTCVANDYSYEEIFSRQLNALGRDGDVLVAITTSGKSENIKQALIQAQNMKIKTIGLLGKKGGECKDYSDISLIVPSDITARIQEMHILIEHLLCELVEHKLGLN
ncbi:D-sedoheptulose 7-phosphate isomerase [Candidatus Pelagibacter sp.]|nr:D-sedoheptulose 7-phosphate isomerase [Candidatus Pelagibacter sp.]MDC0992655.1 D-sedoheptulose 7-phosphate isomerase [Candidatus Pelagibacter sp.]